MKSIPNRKLPKGWEYCSPRDAGAVIAIAQGGAKTPRRITYIRQITPDICAQRAAQRAAHVAAFDARRTPEERAAIAKAAAYRVTAPYRPVDAGDGNRIGGHRD
jgi:hypothetical protein